MIDESEWVSLGEAAKLLGVHPATVRNWADQGEIPFRRTPGRHRRFQRSALLEWSAGRAEKEKSGRPSDHAQAIVEYALGHAHFSNLENNLRDQDWYGRFSPEGLEKSRQIGRKLLEGLLSHLKDTVPEGEELSEARRLGTEYGTFLQNEGLTLVQAARGFVFFHDFLVEAVVQIMAPNLSSTPSEWSDLLQQTNAFTNEVLVAMIGSYSS